MRFLLEIKNALLQLAYPHLCAGCATTLHDNDHLLCLKCLTALPETKFHLHKDNPTEKMFWGRLPLKAASSQYYFTKESLMQHLVHEIKYKGNKALGQYLGRLVGFALLESNRFSTVDCVIPLPLHASREFKRGYNQSALLAESIGEILNVPVLNKAAVRVEATETQTRMGRVERWQNMEGKFAIKDPELIRNKHVLLVDDVVTTGATLEACGQQIISDGAELSLVTLCFSTH